MYLNTNDNGRYIALVGGIDQFGLGFYIAKMDTRFAISIDFLWWSVEIAL